MRRVVLFALIFAVLAGTAEAACPRGAQCGTVTVPLDHAGATAGTLPLAYARVPATGTRTGTIVFLSGGPGQAALPLTDDIAAILRPLRATHDLVTVDQRGTGESGAVDCFTATIDECATRLGDRRAFFNTAETARDVEDLRVALGGRQADIARRLLRDEGGGRVRAPVSGSHGRGRARLARCRSTGSTSSASCGC